MSTSVQNTKYGRIFQELSARIQNGGLAPGEQLPVSRELAEQYQTSILTVRQAIAELVKNGLVYSVQGKGVFVAAPSSYVAAEARTIHFLGATSHSDIGEDQFLGTLLLHLSELAYSQNTNVTVALMPRHQSLWDYFRSGIAPSMRNGIIINTNQEPPEELQKIFRSEKIPYALIPYQTIPGVPQVCSDGAQAWRAGLNHLHRLGHKDILVLVNSEAMPTILEFAREIFGADFPPERILPVTPWEERSGAQAFQLARRMNLNFTAIFSFGDCATQGVIHELNLQGVNIPDDVSLLTYDRYPQQDRERLFQLSGYQQNIRGMARALLNLLAEERDGGVAICRETLIPMDFISGNSCILNPHL